MSTMTGSRIDAQAIRAEFPYFTPHPEMRSLIYLDNAATTQKPRSVIDSISHFYSYCNANVHRGSYGIGARASEMFEGARVRTAQFLNTNDTSEIIFTQGTTESINLVAATWGKENIQAGDEIIVSEMEHHANILPWRQLCLDKGARLKVWHITDEGRLELNILRSLLTERTKMVAVMHISNVLGTINPAKEICQIAHEAGAKVLIDAAQSVAHMPVDVQQMGCDFLAFSGHKIYGPTGIGVLYGRKEILEGMPPYQQGGGMIRRVTWDEVTWADVPFRFEAGTPPIAEAVGLHAALDFVDSLGREAIETYEAELTRYALERLKEIPALTLYGPTDVRAGLFAFNLGDVHPHDIQTVVDTDDIAIRAGHHCAHPLGDRIGTPATARASIAVYNDEAHIDALIRALHKVCEVFNVVR